MDPAICQRLQVVTMLISGHKHIEMMEHYTHLDEKFIYFYKFNTIDLI